MMGLGALQPDPEVASLELAFSLERVEELFAERILPAVWPGRSLAKRKRLYVAYKPSRKCMMSYALHFAGSGRVEYVTLTFGVPQKLRRTHTIRYGSRNELAPGGAFLIPEVPCLVEVFPADWKIPSLSEAISLGAIDPGPRASGSTPLPVREVRVLRYRAHRCAVLHYVLGDGSQGVIGKAYSRSAVAWEVRAKLERLGGQARELGIAVPGIVESAGPDALVLMERLPGENIARLLEEARDLHEAQELVRTAARTLSAFRTMKIESGRRRTIAGELERLPPRAQHLPLVAPQLHDEVQTLLRRLSIIAGKLPPAPDSLIHGDYKPSQLLFHEDRTAIVDLDRACHGDPAIDVGNFAAALLKESLVSERRYFRRIADTFLEEVGREQRGDRLTRAAHVFLVLALVRMGVRMFERNPTWYVQMGSAWPAGRLLEEAARRLTVLESSGEDLGADSRFSDG